MQFGGDSHNGGKSEEEGELYSWGKLVLSFPTNKILGRTRMRFGFSQFGATTIG